MQPEVGPWQHMRVVGERFGVGPNAIREWALAADAHRSRVYFTRAERMAAAECLANLSRAQPNRPAAEIAQEVAYAFGVSVKALRTWVRMFGLYRRPKVCSENHPWKRDDRRHFDGHTRHKIDRR